MQKRLKIFISVLASSVICAQFACYAGQVSPLSHLSDPEKDYYEKVFNYSMEVVKPGQKYDWASYSGKGSISIGQQFVSKSGATCRNFSETFNVRGQNGIDKGVGCKRRGQDGWCKLDLQKEVQTCSFEDTSRMFGGISITTPSITGPSNNDVPDISGPDVNVNTNVNTNIDTGPKKDITPKGYANTVTGGAGQAAGSAASSGINWFTQMFK